VTCVMRPVAPAMLVDVAFLAMTVCPYLRALPRRK
jgi:hypothetical protein